MRDLKPLLFRDPVHDTIALRQESEAHQFLLRILDTPEVQRLRRIRQLGLTSLVYPGAEHSRFQHSLGVLWTAHQMLARLETRTPLDDSLRLTILAAALLHDVGHGPMSHAIESITKIDHEAWTLALIGAPPPFADAPETGPLAKLLHSFDPALPARIIALISKTPLPPDLPPFARDIVSSQMDADRLDYILRDGHATGVRIGHYDLARILALVAQTDDGHLAVHAGAQEAVEGYLLARFHMYKQVYLHKTGRVAEKMLEAAFARARHLHADGRPPAYWPGGPFGRLLLGQSLSPWAFASLDDGDVFMALKFWAEASDPSLAALAGGLVHRRLYKPIPLPADPHRAHERIEAARSVARVKGFDPDTAILVDESQDTAYQPFTGLDRLDGSIRILDNQGQVSFIEDRSEVVHMLSQLQLRQRILCVHPEIQAHILRIF